MKRARRKVGGERKSSLVAFIAAVLLIVGVASFGGTKVLVSVVPVWAADHLVVIADRSGAEGGLLNPHSDLIFRATDATSCLDCHGQAEMDGSSPRSRIMRRSRNSRRRPRGFTDQDGSRIAFVATREATREWRSIERNENVE